MRYMTVFILVGGGGGYLPKFNTGRLCPEVQPLTLLYTILAEKVPFYIPTLGSLVFISMQSA